MNRKRRTDRMGSSSLEHSAMMRDLQREDENGQQPFDNRTLPRRVELMSNTKIFTATCSSSGGAPASNGYPHGQTPFVASPGRALKKRPSDLRFICPHCRKEFTSFRWMASHVTVSNLQTRIQFVQVRSLQKHFITNQSTNQNVWCQMSLNWEEDSWPRWSFPLRWMCIQVFQRGTTFVPSTSGSPYVPALSKGV